MKTFLLFYIISFLFLQGEVFAKNQTESCGLKCHINPKFTKEDKRTLEECVHCHSSTIHKAGDEVEVTALNPDKNKSLEKMAHIPEGEFIMGTDDRLRDEKPAHVVYIDDFYMDMYEVTNDYYKKFVDHTDYPPPDHWKGGSYPESIAQHPVVFVSWIDANNYCKWAGKRLPREMEWEKAARGTDGRKYPWGNHFDKSKANTSLGGIMGTVPVGSYSSGQSPYGIFNMAGNVWEWTSSRGESDEKMIVKGGSWGLSHRFSRSFSRVEYQTKARVNNVGFRCALDK